MSASWQRDISRFLIASLFAVIASLAIWTTTAQAASGQINIIATNSPPQLSGAPTNYVINFTCSATEVESCGANPTIRIPIDITSSFPDTPALTDWTFAVNSGGTPGLVTNWQLVGNEIVVELDPALISPGDSKTLNLSVTPPNGYTPDGTSWEIQPTYESSTIPEAEAPDPAIGEAEAEARLSVSKNTNDGGSVYVVGNRVIYNITASCNPGFPRGSLYLTEAKLVDTLPPDAVFVSASPAPTSAPTPPTPGGQITWDFANPGGMPPGCVPGAGGTSNYQVIVEVPNTVADETVLYNSVTMSGKAIGNPDDELTSSASKDVTAISVPPANPGTFLGKGSQGPLEIDGLGFKGTYPGHWIQPVDTTPNPNSVGTAEGRYTMTVSYPASRAFQTDLVDPMPCLTNKAGVKYSSLPVVGDVNGSASAPVCAQPAFHPTVIRVVSASMPQAVANNFTIELIRTNGTVITVPVGSTSGTSAFFPVPSGEIGNIAAFRIPPSADLTDRSMTIDVWGYADASAQAGEIVEDITAATAYPVDDLGTPAGTGRDADELYIEETQPQLAVFKSFGGYRSGSGGTTPLNLVGGVTIPTGYTLPGPVVLTDLLPEDMTWTNPPGSGTASFTLSQGLNNVGSITGDVEYLTNYQGSGRDLIRISFDPADFPTSPANTGYFRLTPPGNMILVSVPQEARAFNNTAQIFVSGSGQNTTSSCGIASGSNASDFESEDPRDLDGDGETHQNHCSYGAVLQAQGLPGAGFGLSKKVQGELDPAPLGAGQVAETNNGGTGEYTLVWRNTATDPLTDPVVYDILPYVGDTGVNQGQSGTPRGSQFQVAFEEISHLDPGVTVEYSDSTNPCRPEVYPAAPGCVNDWVSTPDDPADVRSLRFTATGTYTSGQTFEMRFKVRLPMGEVNTIAWNSSASTAMVGSTYLLPAEPPKVGITAHLDPVTPTLSTQVSSADVAPGTALTDRITVGGADDINGDLDWVLYGPVDVGNATNCDAVNWTGAPIAGQGSFAITGSGVYDTAPTTVSDFGCYGYEVTIDSPGFTDPVTSPVGSVNEIAIIRRLQPTVSTMVSSARVTPGQSVTDRITVGQTEGRPGTIDWSLVGPVALNSDWTCEGVSWDGAAVVDQGTLATNGDGEYETPATTVPSQGCYGYVVTVGGAQIGGSANSPAGSPNEVVLVRENPGRLNVTKKADRKQVEVGSKVRYTIVVRNNGRGPVPSVRLVDRPVKPMRFVSARASQGSCNAKFPLVCQLGTIDANRRATVTVVAIPLVTGAVPNTATASTPDPEVDPKTDRERIRGKVTLRIEKKANRNKVRAGGRIGYRIKVTNPSPTAVRNAKVCDRPPAGLEITRTAPTATLQNGAWCWRVKRIAPHSSVVMRVYARALKGATGRLSNVAWVEGQDIRTRRDRAGVQVVRPRPPKAGGVTG